MQKQVEVTVSKAEYSRLADAGLLIVVGGPLVWDARDRATGGEWVTLVITDEAE